MDVLPLPSILAKLKQIDTNAPEWIIDRMEDVSRQRRDIEKMLLTRSFWHGVVSPLCIMIGQPSEYRRYAEINSNEVWPSVGNDMRKAYKDYFNTHPGSAESVQLTEAETASLECLGDNADIYDRIKPVISGFSGRVPNTSTRGLSL